MLKRIDWNNLCLLFAKWTRLHESGGRKKDRDSTIASSSTVNKLCVISGFCRCRNVSCTSMPLNGKCLSLTKCFSHHSLDKILYTQNNLISVNILKGNYAKGRCMYGCMDMDVCQVCILQHYTQFCWIFVWMRNNLNMTQISVDGRLCGANRTGLYTIAYCVHNINQQASTKVGVIWKCFAEKCCRSVGL